MLPKGRVLGVSGNFSWTVVSIWHTPSHVYICKRSMKHRQFFQSLFILHSRLTAIISCGAHIILSNWSLPNN